MDSMSEVSTPQTRSYGSSDSMDAGGGEAKRTLLAGLIGAAVASIGYVIYSRLEEEQKSAIRQSLSKLVEDKVADVRSQLKI